MPRGRRPRRYTFAIPLERFDLRWDSPDPPPKENVWPPNAGPEPSKDQDKPKRELKKRGPRPKPATDHRPRVVATNVTVYFN
jgi:hypothetical protein